MLILINEQIQSRSGPAKSINLLKKSIFKSKKHIYCYRNKNIFFFDFFIGNKIITNKNIFYLIKLILNEKVIFINGVYSLFFFILPIVIGLFKIKKIIISPRGQIAPETLVKKRFLKLFFFKLLTIVQGIIPSKLFWLVTSTREKIFLQFFIQYTHLDVTIVDNLNDIKIKKFSKINKKKNSLNLFYFSNITQKKNLFDSINIVKNTKNPNIKFNIYGKIIDHSYFKKILHLIKDHPNIKYKGYIDNNLALEKIFLKHHFLVHHSLGENYGHILVESMAYGLPFISNTSHPFSEVDDNFDGFVLPKGLIFQQVDFINKLFTLNNKSYQIYRKKFYNFFLLEIAFKEKKRLKMYYDFFGMVERYKFKIR